MTTKEKQIKRATEKAERLGALDDALALCVFLLDKETKNAEAMAKIPGQKFAHEWDNEAKDYRRKLEIITELKAKNYAQRLASWRDVEELERY